MIVSRKIGNVECDININEANEVYFSKNFTELIKGKGISGILDAIYLSNENKFMPLSVFVEMTNSCNFSCPFCYINEIGKNHNQIPSFNALKKDFDYLISNGLLYCVFSGGECLLHPSFLAIYECLKKSGVLVSVFTNAYLLEEKHFEMFEKYKPFNIEISIYGIDDITYRNTTNSQNISAKVVFENILRLQSLGINVICKTPITNLTEDFYLRIQEWCDCNNIQYYNGIEMLNTYSGAETKIYKASDNVCDRFNKQANYEFWHDSEMNDIMISDTKCKFAFECSGGRYDIFINSQYSLLPCMKAMNNDEWSFDIECSGMKVAYEKLTDKIKVYKGKKLKYCCGCTHHQICQECFMTQYDYEDLQKHRVEYCNWLKDFIIRGKCINKF